MHPGDQHTCEETQLSALNSAMVMSTSSDYWYLPSHTTDANFDKQVIWPLSKRSIDPAQGHSFIACGGEQGVREAYVPWGW